MRATQHTKEIGDHDFYEAYTLTNLYVERVFGDRVSTINLTNDSTTDTVQFSWDGATLAGEVSPGQSVRITTNQKPSIYVKGTAGGDDVRIWSYADVSASNITANVSFSPLGVVNKTYEGQITAGVSPVTIDFNADAGRNSREGWIANDGAGDILVAFSRDGVTFGDNWTMKTGELTNLANFDIDTLRLTHVADADYRIVLI